MILQFKEIRFLDGRRHKFRNKKESIKGITSVGLYERKKLQRLQRAAEISKNAKIEAYIDWIVSLQKRLNLSNSAFAARLGITAQSVTLWKRRTGHFPSERVYKKLLQLEKESQIPFCFTKIRLGVKLP